MSLWQGLESCIGGHGSAAQLLRAWQELRGSVETWLEVRDRPSHTSPSRVQASALWAVQALQLAARQGPDELMQVRIDRFQEGCRV